MINDALYAEMLRRAPLVQNGVNRLDLYHTHWRELCRKYLFEEGGYIQHGDGVTILHLLGLALKEFHGQGRGCLGVNDLDLNYYQDEFYGFGTGVYKPDVDLKLLNLALDHLWLAVILKGHPRSQPSLAPDALMVASVPRGGGSFSLLSDAVTQWSQAPHVFVDQVCRPCRNVSYALGEKWGCEALVTYRETHV